MEILRLYHTKILLNFEIVKGVIQETNIGTVYLLLS